MLQNLRYGRATFDENMFKIGTHYWNMTSLGGIFFFFFTFQCALSFQVFYSFACSSFVSFSVILVLNSCILSLMEKCP